MDFYFLQELKEKYQEIMLDTDNELMINKVVEAYNRICHFSKLARREGLLTLEEAKNKLNTEDDTEQLFADLISLIVDGSDPEFVKEVGMNKYIVSGLKSYMGLICLMYINGSLMIQNGTNMIVIGYVLKSMMPKHISNIIKMNEEKSKNDLNFFSYSSSQSTDSVDLDENYFSLASETSKAITSLSDSAIQRLIIDFNNDDLIVAMKGMSSAAQSKILNNMSPRLGAFFAEQLSYLEVRDKDITDSCIKLIKLILKLYDLGEISGYDFSLLKFVLDLQNEW